LRNIADGENTTRSVIKERTLSVVLCKTAFRMLKELQTSVLCWSKSISENLFLFTGEAECTIKNMNQE
jgi:hypothetical protein